MRAAYHSELAYMVEDGAYPQDVDRILYGEFGMQMGPFQSLDLTGTQKNKNRSCCVFRYKH